MENEVMKKICKVLLGIVMIYLIFTFTMLLFSNFFFTGIDNPLVMWLIALATLLVIFIVYKKLTKKTCDLNGVYIVIGLISIYLFYYFVLSTVIGTKFYMSNNYNCNNLELIDTKLVASHSFLSTNYNRSAIYSCDGDIISLKNIDGNWSQNNSLSSEEIKEDYETYSNFFSGHEINIQYHYDNYSVLKTIFLYGVDDDLAYKYLATNDYYDQDDSFSVLKFVNVIIFENKEDFDKYMNIVGNQNHFSSDDNNETKSWDIIEEQIGEEDKSKCSSKIYYSNSKSTDIYHCFY